MALMKQHFGVQGLVYSGRIPNLSGIAGAFGIPYNGWMEADDAITYANTRPEMLRALLWLRRLYELNLVDVESSTLSQDQAEERYIDGKSGFMIFNGGHHVTRIDDMMKQVDPNAQEWLLPAPAGPDGKRGYVVEPSFWGVTFITDTSRNPVSAAALLNYLMTEEGQKLTAYGVEGIHYLEPSPGNIQPIDSGREQETATHWDGNRYHQLASPIISWVNWKYQLWWSLRGKPESYVDWFSEMWTNQCRYTTRNAILLPLTVKWSQFQQFSTELTQEYFSRIILGDGNPERLFTEYVDKWFSGGGKEAVQEITRMKLSQIGPR